MSLHITYLDTSTVILLEDVENLCQILTGFVISIFKDVSNYAIELLTIIEEKYSLSTHTRKEIFITLEKVSIYLCQ